MELDLVQQVAELLDQRVLGRGIVGVERGEGVDELERLLDEVRHQAGVGLLAVPRTALPQRSGELVEAHVPGAHRGGEARDVHTREVVGLDGPVELAPRGVGDLFVVGAESLEEHDRFVAGGLLDGELDVGEDPVGVGVGDEQRTGRAGGCGGEVVAVDQPHTGFDRIDAEPRPRQVEERHRRQQLHRNPAVGEEQTHRTLEHERRARNRIEHLAVLPRRVDEGVHDRRVHVVVRRRRLVEVVERRGVADDTGARVDRGAQIAMRDAGDRVPGLGRHVPVASGPEADDRDRHCPSSRAERSGRAESQIRDCPRPEIGLRRSAPR
jgi:hypothetical protein